MYQEFKKIELCNVCIYAFHLGKHNKYLAYKHILTVLYNPHFTFSFKLFLSSRLKHIPCVLFADPNDLRLCTFLNITSDRSSTILLHK